MDSANWRKFLTSAGSVEIQKNNELNTSRTSVLKSLLGRWHHRQKRQLLRNNDEETSPTQGRTNPIYEGDSDDAPQNDETEAVKSTALQQEQSLHESFELSDKRSENARFDPSNKLVAKQESFAEKEINLKESNAAQNEIIQESNQLSKLKNAVNVEVERKLSNQDELEIHSSNKQEPATEHKNLIEQELSEDVITSNDDNTSSSSWLYGPAVKKKTVIGENYNGYLKPNSLQDSFIDDTENAAVKASTSTHVENKQNLSNEVSPNLRENTSATPESKSEEKATVGNNVGIRKRAIDELIKKFQGSPTIGGRNFRPLNVVSKTEESNITIIKKDEVLNDTETKSILTSPTNPKSYSNLEINVPQIPHLPFKIPPPPPEIEFQKASTQTKLDEATTSSLQRSDSSLNRGLSVAHQKSEVNTRQYVKKAQKGNNKIKVKRRTIADSASSIKAIHQATSNNVNNTEPELVKNYTEGITEISNIFPPNVRSEKSTIANFTNVKKSQVNSIPITDFVQEQQISELKDAAQEPTIPKSVYENIEHILDANETPNTILKQSGPETIKVQSEDSGITRGDQISDSSLSQNIPQSHQDEKKEKSEKITYDKIKDPNQPSKRLPCKHCRNKAKHSAQGKCDDYYDRIIGFHPQGARLRNSWTSDISWEEFVEKEYFKQLRHKKLRSSLRSMPNAHSRKSYRGRHRKRLFPPMEYSTDKQGIRRSFSDGRSSSLNDHYYKSSPSLCSCDACAAADLGRASVRSKRRIPKRHISCTCEIHSPRFSVDSRKVKFAEQSQDVHKSKLKENVLGIPRDTENAGDTVKQALESTPEFDEGSQKSFKAKEHVPIKNESNGTKKVYMSPWELELWESRMRIQSLKARRKRARFMGVMALSIVAIVGLGVTLLIVFLRNRKHSLS